jgi:hypothetical protein
MTSVAEWRIFCTTEEQWVTSWGISAPTQCNNNTTHTVNLQSVQQLQTINENNVSINNLVHDTIDTQLVTEHTPIIDLKSFNGFNKTSKYSVSGAATITALPEETSEFQMTINNPSDTANIRSAKRGYYIAGLVSECGIALRIPVPLDTTQVLKYGYFDDNNGYYFKITDNNTLSLCIKYNNVVTEISRTNFNKNKLDGTESHGINLDFAKGNIFRIDFTWYGYGIVVFGSVQSNSLNEQKFYPLHVYNTNTHTSCGNPSLPITVSLESNMSSVQTSVFVAGRQYSILGKLIENSKRNMYFINNASTTTGNSKPLFSIKNKDKYKTCSVSFKNIRGIADTNTRITFLENASLNTISYQENPYVDESAVTIDTSASIITNGYAYKSFLVLANVPFDISLQTVDLFEDSTMTLVHQPLTANGSISLQLDWDERW